MRRTLLLALGLLLVLAPPASADWFQGDAVDGPSADVREVGEVDVARDGDGGLVYTKVDGGVPHVFLSRLVSGGWRAPERLDGSIGTAATQPRVAAAVGGRLAVVWVSAGRLYGVVITARDSPPAAPAELHADPDPLRAVEDPDLEMGINGTAYATFVAPGGDVRAVRLQDVAWEAVGTPLDIDPAAVAGRDLGRPRVAVSAEGNAVVVWGERSKVYGRRVTGLVPSVAPQELSLPEIEGRPGGDADSPDVDIEDDGSFAWAAFRQEVGGVTRSITRRLVGSLFEAPAFLDAGSASGAPQIGMNGRGIGIGVSVLAGSGQVFGSVLENDMFQPVAGRIDSLGGATEVVTEASERRSVAVAWRASGEVRGRHKLDRARFDGEALLSRPEWGPVVADSLSLAEDRTGNFAVAFLQGPVDARRVVAAVFDKAATAPAGRTTTKWLRRSQPRLAWRAGLDLWGAQTFRVLIDNVEVGRTTASFLVTPGPVDDGAHRWRVVAVDRRGQETPGRVRTLRVDSTSPDVTVRVDGKRKRGQTLKFRVTAADVGGSGVTRVLVRFGDGTPTVPVGRTFAHRYRHRGSYTATVRVYDRAGNVERFPVRLRIRK